MILFHWALVSMQAVFESNLKISLSFQRGKHPLMEEFILHRAFLKFNLWDARFVLSNLVVVQTATLLWSMLSWSYELRNNHSLS